MCCLLFDLMEISANGRRNQTRMCRASNRKYGHTVPEGFQGPRTSIRQRPKEKSTVWDLLHLLSGACWWCKLDKLDKSSPSSSSSYSSTGTLSPVQIVVSDFIHIASPDGFKTIVYVQCVVPPRLLLFRRVRHNKPPSFVIF